MRKICTDEGRKKAFEDYSADLYNQHPWHNKCSVVLGMFVCVVSSFFSVVGSYLDAEASLAPSPVNWLVGWLVGQFVSCFQMSTLSVSLDRYRASKDHGIQETISGKS